MNFNPYKILTVDPKASFEVIKAAYRTLMKQKDVHPDLGGTAKIAQEINHAYETLKDPEKRKAIDLDLNVHNSFNTNQPQKLVYAVCLYCQTVNELTDERLINIATCGKCNRHFINRNFESNKDDQTFYKHRSKPKKEKKEQNFQLAFYLYNRGMYLRALEDFQALRIQEPGNSEYDHMTGLCYFRLKNYLESSRFFLKAISKQPFSFKYNLWLGKSLLKSNQRSEAVQFFQKALNIEPSNINCLALLGTTKYKLGNYEGAIQSLKNVVITKPALYQSAYWLALSYYRIRHFEEALQYFDLGKKIFHNLNHIDEMIQHCIRHIRTSRK